MRYSYSNNNNNNNNNNDDISNNLISPTGIDSTNNRKK